MAKQTINLGTTPNRGDGDPLRTAFRKINENFDELYSGAASELGAFEFGGSTITTTDSSDITIAQNVTITSDLTMSGDIVPAADNAYDLGSPTQQWRSLYLTGNTVYFNGVPLSVTDDGTIIVNGQVAATPGGATTWDSVTNKPAFANVATSGSYNDLADKPTIPDVSNFITAADIPRDYQGSVFADDSTLLVDGVNASIPYSVLSGAPAIPADISDLTDNESLLGSSGTELPSQSGQEGKFLRTDGENLSWVAITSAAGPVQPYLELTNTPFITQPVTLGTPVTAIADLRGQDALVEVVIGEGPVIESITVTTPGVLYVVGQRYRINYWQVGGNSDNGNIDFEVATVGAGGALLTIANAAFEGLAQVNTGTYSNVSIEYRPTEFDVVGTGLTLTRGLYGGLFNSEEEFSYNSSVSPIGTLWNADGWGTLVGFNTRTYERFDLILTGPDNTPPGELIMWDTINDKYYKFAINIWGVDNNEFSYTRTLVTDPNYFRKDDNATANNVDVIEDDSTLQIGITRGVQNGIYNPFTEEGWDSGVSPQGTLWNIDGWDDLTDVETRTYTNFYAAYGNGQLGNRVPGSKAVMYVPSIEKYYAIEWLGWTQNNQGGGFSYTRREIDLTKLTQGITFADGTVQTTAYTGTNVLSTAVGDRRIETASGYKEVSVTQRVTNNYTGSTSQTTNGYELRIARTPELDAVIIPLNENNTDETYALSFDNVTFREVWLSSIQETEYWFYYQVDNNQTTPQTENDPVYLRITTGGDSVVWWNKTDLPGTGNNFRGAVIDYHAYTGESTIIGTIHIVDDDGEEHISHQEVQSGSTDGENDDLWLVTTEGQIKYRRIDGESKTLKIHWTAKVFYGSELYD